MSSSRPDERRDVAGAGLGGEERLARAEDERHVDALALGGQHLRGLEPLGDAGDLDHDVLVKRGEVAALLHHALGVGRHDLARDRAVDRLADLDQDLLGVARLLRQQARVGGDAVHDAERRGLADLLEARGVQKDLHDSSTFRSRDTTEMISPGRSLITFRSREARLHRLGGSALVAGLVEGGHRVGVGDPRSRRRRRARPSGSSRPRRSARAGRPGRCDRRGTRRGPRRPRGPRGPRGRPRGAARPLPPGPPAPRRRDCRRRPRSRPRSRRAGRSRPPPGPRSRRSPPGGPRGRRGCARSSGSPISGSPKASPPMRRYTRKPLRRGPSGATRSRRRARRRACAPAAGGGAGAGGTAGAGGRSAGGARAGGRGVTRVQGPGVEARPGTPAARAAARAWAGRSPSAGPRATKARHRPRRARRAARWARRAAPGPRARGSACAGPSPRRAIPRAATRRVVPGAGSGSACTTRLPGTAGTARRWPAFSRSFSPSA